MLAISAGVDLRACVLSHLCNLPETAVHAEFVFPLLRAMKFRNVQYVHGTFERGKDLLFQYLNPFGSLELAVCQVKNAPFSGNLEM
ncbi:MAG: hypothetical protein ACT4QC_09575 [Planctomycetaceae bacterium]